ncbi:MAG: VWA domain-containing protein [Aeriscardovia sp.]|nr:VWA domain-containing protein [Aeriscardovia sp.]
MSGIVLRWPWALLAGGILLAILLILVFWFTRRKYLKPDAAKVLSSKERLKTTLQALGNKHKKQTPGIRLLSWGLKTRLKGTAWGQYRTYKALVVSCTVFALLSFGCAMGLVSRPSSIEKLQSTSISRNIVLCLDVSGSALPFDEQVIASYLQLVSKFKTERIGMSIFNSTSKTVFPLTDDYKLVTSELDSALTALKGVVNQTSINNMTTQQYQDINNFLSGTDNMKGSSSLIGDGLVSCENMFPGFSASAQTTQARVAPASIVLATDNILAGRPVYTLHQAMQLAKFNSIRVDGLYVGESSNLSTPDAVAFKQQVDWEGGSFFSRQDGQSVEELVQNIEDQKIKQQTKEQTVDITDNPDIWVIVLVGLICLLFLLLGWVRR